MSGRKGKRLSASEVSAFCEQIALLLNGGIPIYEGTCILYEEIKDRETKRIVKEIDQLVKENRPFYEAIEKSGVFPAYMVHMVKIGETTGKLEEVMDSLANYYGREDRLKKSIRNVIFYPVMLFATMGVILMVLVLKILPMFQNVFHELDAGTSKASGHMMAASMMVGKAVTIGVAVIFLLILAAILMGRTKAGKESLRKIGSYTPYVRRVMYKVEIGKFISAMSLMISSGIDSEEALELSSELVDHPVIRKRICHCLKSMRNHETLEDSLTESRLITGMDGRMVSIGAKTGVLDAVFEKLSIRQEEEIDQSLGEMATILETILVISLSVIVGLVLVSVILPLISIISAIG